MDWQLELNPCKDSWLKPWSLSFLFWSSMAVVTLEGMTWKALSHWPLVSQLESVIFCRSVWHLSQNNSILTNFKTSLRNKHGFLRKKTKPIVQWFVMRLGVISHWMNIFSVKNPILCVGCGLWIFNVIFEAAPKIQFNKWFFDISDWIYWSRTKPRYNLVNYFGYGHWIFCCLLLVSWSWNGIWYDI